ncbi:class B sortase [Lachnospiraceae bacterium 45-W7]
MRNRRRYRVIRAVLLLVAIVCLIPVGQAYYLSFQHQVQEQEIKGLLETEKETGKQTDIRKEAGKPEDGSLDKLKTLYGENDDFVGWLAMEGTNIDYPVVQSEEDAYYLSHNFYKEKDKYGCLYVKAIADVYTPGTNVIIYGHNMRDGSMFGTLDRYRDESFFREHAAVSFDTLYEERVYQVMAVFETRLYQEDAYPYYQFYEAQTEREFQDFYENVKRMSLYDTGVTAKYGDTFLTLSTCSDAGDDGRFVVVAKKMP